MKMTSIKSSSTGLMVWRNCEPCSKERTDLFDNNNPLGFEASDANLFRYVGNNPTNATDPSGLLKAAAGAAFTNQFGVPTGVFYWSFKAPEAPKDLQIYTYVDMKWEVRKCKNDPDKPRKGNYSFWFEGLLNSRELRWNLSSYHGSHLGANNKRKPWPIFDGETRRERNKQLKNYLMSSFDLTNTCGTLTVRLVYRGYKVTATEKFNPKLEREQGGPFEIPCETKARNGKPEFRHPNRMRSPLRAEMPWLAEMPKIWNTKPEWEHVIELTYTWDWFSKNFGKYTIKYTGKDPISGTTPYSRK